MTVGSVIGGLVALFILWKLVRPVLVLLVAGIAAIFDRPRRPRPVEWDDEDDETAL
jgi:hypothetical protein